MLDETQRRHLDELVARYTAATRRSRERYQQARPALADPRSSQGYSSAMPAAAREHWLATQALRYPIVASHGEGARVWDVDGNEYVDFCLGFGVHLFGHRPAFLEDALRARIGRGLPIGYQSDSANEVAQAVTAMTGVERVAFCNTGTEAVMGALRLARAATGRDRVALFAGSYHGTLDAVLPAGGTTRGLSATQRDETLVLDYAAPESLERIAEQADHLAAVLVEPIQARNPRVQPREFLEALRRLTTARDVALVFDDVLLGFRLHQGGSQAFFGVRADLATFGKVLGGGLPIGAIGGSARFLDAIDGGPTPTHVDKVLFAGTFNKNPLTMAAAAAVGERLREAGPALQAELGRRTAALAERTNQWLEAQAAPIRLEPFGAAFRLAAPPSLWIIMAHLRLRGIYAFDGMTFFVSTAHGEPELAQFEAALADSVRSLREGGLLG